MGLFSKGSKAVAKAAVGVATAATASLGGGYAKQHVQSQTAQSHRTMNQVSRAQPKPPSGPSK